jgi:hypothetical protein
MRMPRKEEQANSGEPVGKPVSNPMIAEALIPRLDAYLDLRSAAEIEVELARKTTVMSVGAVSRPTLK